MQNLNLNGRAPEHIAAQQDPSRSPMMILSEISRLMIDKLREKDADNPITQRSERLLLIELAKRDGRTQLDLVKATHLKAPTISVALQKMEKEGYVTRRSDEYDLRATRVFLTEKGRSLDNKIKKRIVDEENLAIRGLTEAEKETLSRILLKIRNNLLIDRDNNFDQY